MHGSSEHYSNYRWAILWKRSHYAARSSFAQYRWKSIFQLYEWAVYEVLYSLNRARILRTVRQLKTAVDNGETAFDPLFRQTTKEVWIVGPTLTCVDAEGGWSDSFYFFVPYDELASYHSPPFICLVQVLHLSPSKTAGTNCLILSSRLTQKTGCDQNALFTRLS